MGGTGVTMDWHIAPLRRRNSLLPDAQRSCDIDGHGRFREGTATVRPGSGACAAQVVRLLYRSGIAIVPQGGNAGKNAGGTACLSAGTSAAAGRG
ncbi:hypothetical protein Mnod_8125 (plasmid) [Methylobacterium nodulans ORS 2060]|uniref:FAD linked oxidase domain protein n=1 Tax=Methylobacterium nodulans (strain LMG 21967 / CNCM I-2342 / ORS 2060) TaxID=460265 RepID=B8IX67_METNO|nr:hypothetical protein Mnod_8125 [Methylobacterium nodulans ORS 2060]